MPKRVKYTSNFNFGELPMNLPCPNEKCDGKISFKVSDIEVRKTVECAKCGTLVNLKPTE